MKKKIFQAWMLSTVLTVPLTTFIVQEQGNIVYAIENIISTPNGIANMGDGPGSILIRPNGSQSLIDKDFVVYKLFDVTMSADGNSIHYTINSDYRDAIEAIIEAKLSKDEVREDEIIDTILSFDESEFRTFVKNVRDRLQVLNKEGTRIHISQCTATGNIELLGLDLGYYLIDEVTNVDQSNSASSMILVNTTNPSATIDIKSDYPSVEKKIYEDDQGVGWNDIADYLIGQAIPFRYTSRVPNMTGYDTYSFIFHDKMDASLSLDINSIDIVISSTTKNYTLEQSEFNLEQNEEGFKVEISDLKNIVDREFDGTYDQSIVLNYQASLNDQAAMDTGRPGLENSVCLEFSNDPENSTSRGKTPWDTTVVFTYQIEGLKQNDKQQALEGAVFSLYSDAACKNQIYTKKVGDNYIVTSSESEDVDIVSDDTGFFSIVGLDQGTYYLKEIQAPEGYRKLDTPIEITITPEFTQDRNSYISTQGQGDTILKSLSATAKMNQSTTSLETDVSDGSLSLVVTNKAGSVLPITGTRLSVMLIVGGVLIMARSLYRHKQND